MAFKSTPAITSGNAIAISATTANKTQSLQISAKIATTTSLGVVQVGSGLSVTPAGVLTAAGGGGATIGTWTPSLVSSQAATITLSTTNANYAKVGQLVICTFDITVLSETGGGAGATITLQGLPFTSIAEVNGGYVGSVYVSYFVNMDSDTGWLTGSVVNNTTRADMFFSIANPKSLSNLTQNDIKNTTRIVGVVTYVSAT